MTTETIPEESAAELDGARRQASLAMAAGAVAVVIAIGSIGAVLVRPVPAPSAGPEVTPMPTPRVDPEQQRVDALLVAVTSPDRTWRVGATVDLWRDGAQAHVRFEAIVAGRDSSGTVSGTLMTGEHDWVVRGKGRWRRVDGGTWKAVPKLHPNRGWDPFTRLDETVTARFLRWEQKGIERYGQIRFTGLLVLDPTTWFDGAYTVTTVDGASLILDVDGEGRPARGRAEATVTATDQAGAHHEFRLRADYTFRDVGAALAVTPPTNG
jgi:hypothetical protein